MGATVLVDGKARQVESLESGNLAETRIVQPSRERCDHDSNCCFFHFHPRYFNDADE